MGSVVSECEMQGNGYAHKTTKTMTSVRSYTEIVSKSQWTVTTHCVAGAVVYGDSQSHSPHLENTMKHSCP